MRPEASIHSLDARWIPGLNRHHLQELSLFAHSVLKHQAITLAFLNHVFLPGFNI
jgi:hypothetical protein